MGKTKILAALTKLSNELSTKIDAVFVRKEEGKGLSSNDFTDEDKTGLSSSIAHTGDTNVHINETERSEWNDCNDKKHEHSNKSILDNTTASYTIAEREKLSGIATGAEVNQNAFGSFVVGDITIPADTKNASLALVAGANITIEPDGNNKTLTISGTTNHTNAMLGHGYGVCTTASDVTEKLVTLENYILVVGGVITVEFMNDVPANSTMNINGNGAKPIFYRDSAITDDIIKEGNIALFTYNGSKYVLLAIDNNIQESIYNEATETDIDDIISGSYDNTNAGVDDEPYADIDAIIAGTYE